MHALSHAEVQDVRNGFAPIARWTGLPIAADRIGDDRLIPGGDPSLLKIDATMLAPDGGLVPSLSYSTGLRRFAIHPAEGEGPWRVSEHTIGAFVNPTTLSSDAFATQCYRFLLAQETGEPFDAPWLDDPALWPKTLTRTDDLVAARKAIADLRLTQTVVYARSVFGDERWIARWVPGASWSDLEWHDATGEVVPLVPATESLLGTARTWRLLLDSFSRRRVPFTLDADGHRADGATRGLLVPAPITLIGQTYTGRNDWATGERAGELLPDPDEWDQVLADLGEATGADLRRAGIAPRTARALRAGRLPVRRNAEAAIRLASERRKTQAGLKHERSPGCIAPGCPERLHGRQRTFCTHHATYSGSRRRAWRKAAGR